MPNTAPLPDAPLNETERPHDAGHVGHDKHASHRVAMFRDRFWISLALTVPTLIWGHMLESALGLHAPQLPGSQWIPPFFGALTFLYGGRPFLQGSVRELRDRLPGMMTLKDLPDAKGLALLEPTWEGLDHAHRRQTDPPIPQVRVEATLADTAGQCGTPSPPRWAPQLA